MKTCNKCGELIEEGNPLPICLECWRKFVNGSAVSTTSCEL